MNLITEKMITDAEAKRILERRKKEIELKYEQKNALGNLKKFVKISPTKIGALVEELRKVERLRDRQIVAITNFLPEDKDDLRVVLHKEYTSFTKEEIDLILETIKKTI